MQRTVFFFFDETMSGVFAVQRQKIHRQPVKKIKEVSDKFHKLFFGL